MPVTLTAIVPKPIDPNVFVREFRSVADETERELQKMFDKTTATWDHSVKWARRSKISRTVVEVVVGTNDEIYKFVSGGTDEHPIPRIPKSGGALVFRSSYTAKTVPGIIGSHGGGPSGEIRFARQVMHPGTKARDFDRLIASQFERPFRKLVDAAMRRAAKRAQ